jgi:hypothetical protein
LEKCASKRKDDKDDTRELSHGQKKLVTGAGMLGGVGAPLAAMGWDLSERLPGEPVAAMGGQPYKLWDTLTGETIPNLEEMLSDPFHRAMLNGADPTAIGKLEEGLREAKKSIPGLRERATYRIGAGLGGLALGGGALSAYGVKKLIDRHNARKQQEQVSQ